jgi:signal transduction histidine kinase
MAITLPGLAACLLAFALAPHDQLLSPLTLVLAGCALLANLKARDIDDPIIFGGSFVPFILAIGFLGPAATFLIVVLAELGAWAYDRYQVPALLLNTVGCGAPYLLGAAVFTVLGLTDDQITFYLALAVVAAATVAVNAFLVTTLSGVLHGNSIRPRLANHLSHAPAIGVTIGLALGAAAVYAAEGLIGAALALIAIPLIAYMTRQVMAANAQRARIAALAADRRWLVARAAEAAERERRELADTLHDDAVQALLVARQEVAEANRGRNPNLHLATGAIDATIKQLRHAILELHPAVLERAGLVPSLTAVANHLARRGAFTPVLRVSSGAAGLADRLVFSIARELLTNVAKHARATEVALDLRVLDDALVLQVADNGCGFDPSDLSEAVTEGHVGLAAIAERAEAVGAFFDIDSTLGRGTTARIVVPLSVCSDVRDCSAN